MGGRIWQRQGKQEGRHTHDHFSKAHKWPLLQGAHRALPQSLQFARQLFPTSHLPPHLDGNTNHGPPPVTHSDDKQASLQRNSLQQLSAPSRERCFLTSGFAQLPLRPRHMRAVAEGGQEESGPGDWSHVTKSPLRPFRQGQEGVKGPVTLRQSIISTQ